MKRFPPPWTVEHIPGGFKVRDATRRVSLLVAFGFLSCLEITLARGLRRSGGEETNTLRG
jgi:hypothetical protein